MEMFGSQTALLASRLGSALPRRLLKRSLFDLSRPPSQGDDEAKRLKRAEGMTLRRGALFRRFFGLRGEFLIWSRWVSAALAPEIGSVRRLREAEVEWYRQEFKRADVDHGGFLDEAHAFQQPLSSLLAAFK